MSAHLLTDIRSVTQALAHVSAQGRLFRVTFVTRSTHTIRTMVCRVGVVKGLTGVGLRFDPRDYDLRTVWDVQRDGYRMIPLDGVVEIVGRGMVYKKGGVR